MSEPQEIVSIGKNELVGMVAHLFAVGYRLVQIGCNTLESAYELNYSFDKGYRFKNLRISVKPGEEIPSISAVFANAFLYENEIHDLFGLSIRDIAIDYHGTLYRTSIKAPFSMEHVKVPEAPKPTAAVPAQPKEKPKPQVEMAEEQKE